MDELFRRRAALSDRRLLRHDGRDVGGALDFGAGQIAEIGPLGPRVRRLKALLFKTASAFELFEL